MTYEKITENIMVKTERVTEDRVVRYNLTELQEEKDRLTGRIAEIDDILVEASKLIFTPKVAETEGI